MDARFRMPPSPKAVVGEGMLDSSASMLMSFTDGAVAAPEDLLLPGSAVRSLVASLSLALSGGPGKATRRIDWSCGGGWDTGWDTGGEVVSPLGHFFFELNIVSVPVPGPRSIRIDEDNC